MGRRGIDEKVERSIPLQSRIDITTLADLADYLKMAGVHIRSMSGLISDCVEIAWNVLDANNMLQTEHNMTSAHQLFSELGLWQKSMYERSKQKINNAIAFENLRKEGVDPEVYVPRQYNTVHNDHSVKPLGESGKVPVLSSRKTEELVEIYERLEREERIERGKEQPEWKLEDLLRKPEQDDPEVQRKKIEAEGGLVEVERKPSNARNACVVEDEPTKEKLDDSLMTYTDKPREDVNLKDSDVPRPKTEEELEADAERIEEKDRKLMSDLDRWSDVIMNKPKE